MAIDLNNNNTTSSYSASFIGQRNQLKEDRTKFEELCLNVINENSSSLPNPFSFPAESGQYKFDIKYTTSEVIKWRGLKTQTSTSHRFTILFEKAVLGEGESARGVKDALSNAVSNAIDAKPFESKNRPNVPDGQVGNFIHALCGTPQNQ